MCRPVGHRLMAHVPGAGERACSPLVYHDDVLLLMWRKGRDPSLFIGMVAGYYGGNQLSTTSGGLVG